MSHIVCGICWKKQLSAMLEFKISLKCSTVHKYTLIMTAVSLVSVQYNIVRLCIRKIKIIFLVLLIYSKSGTVNSIFSTEFKKRIIISK